MPDPYNPFTDPVVLERLKKSPVEFRDGLTVFHRFTTVEGKVVKEGRTSRRHLWTHVRTKISDAHHIQAAWMVEVANKEAELGVGEPQFSIDWETGEMTVLIGDNLFLGPPIRALALALDWLEGEKT